jgi:hypothetical protein
MPSCASTRAPHARPRPPQELQLQWERARQEEESRGAGAADARRWTGIRNVVEGRELLRTLFKVASDHKAAVSHTQGPEAGGLRTPSPRPP